MFNRRLLSSKQDSGGTETTNCYIYWDGRRNVDVYVNGDYVTSMLSGRGGWVELKIGDTIEFISRLSVCVGYTNNIIIQDYLSTGVYTVTQILGQESTIEVSN